MTQKDLTDKLNAASVMYDYSKVEYKNSKEKVCIICPVHGEFWQTPSNHLMGKGCRQCGLGKRSAERRKKNNSKDL